MSELAVQGCKIQITSGQSAKNILVTTKPSSAVLINNKGVYFDSIDVSLKAVTAGNLLLESGTITINGTASKVLDENGKKALQKNDNATKKFSFTDTVSGSTVSADVTVKITDAGQSDVIAS